MADDVLRLRATVVSEEALANIRKIGREIGLVQAQGGRGAKEAKSHWAELGKTIKEVSGGFEGALATLGPWGIAAGAAAFAADKLVGGLGDIAAEVVKLKYASKELGISEVALRSFTQEAQKAGIAPEAMMQGMQNFKRNTEDFGMRIGALRGQLVAMGAGTVLNRINASTDQLDKLKAAFDFKEVLDKSDPSGMKARRFFEMIGLGADMARLSYDDFVKTMRSKTALTPEEEAKAKRFHDSLIDLKTAWDELKTTVGLSLFPSLSEDLKDIAAFVGWLDKIAAWEPPKWLTPQIGNILGEKTGRALGIDPTGQRAARDKADREREAKQLADAKTAEERKAAEAAGAEGRERRGEQSPEELAAEAAAAKAKQDAAMARMREIERQRREMWKLRPEFQQGVNPSSAEGGGINPAFVHKASFGGNFQAAAPSGDEAGVSRIIQIGVFDALVQFKSYMQAGAGAGSGGGGGGGAPGIERAAYSPGGGGAGGQAAPRPGPGGQGRGPSGATAPTGGGTGGSFLDALAQTESGDRNIVSGTDRDSRGLRAAEGGNVAEISQGNFQIQTATWRDFAGRAGVDLKQYPTAMSAPRDVQARVASVIPFSRFGPRTQRMMRERFGPIDSSQTVGQLAQTHGTGFVPSGAPAGAAPGGIGPEAEPAPSGKAPDAFIMHHTGGRGTPEGVVAEWAKNRPGIGTQFIMDRNGVVHDVRKEFGWTGTGQMIPGTGKGAGLTNKNVAGMEIIARDDKDVTPAQAAAAAEWMKRNYPNTPVLGHGEVNPGHKQATEGQTAVEAVMAERRARRQGVWTKEDAAIDMGRIDQAIAPPAASGQVNVTVNSNGTKAEAQTKTEGQLFQPPVVKQHRQMQPTNDAGGGIEI